MNPRRATVRPVRTMQSRRALLPMALQRLQQMFDICAPFPPTIMSIRPTVTRPGTFAVAFAAKADCPDRDQNETDADPHVVLLRETGRLLGSRLPTHVADGVHGGLAC